jgi:hypothetical protein
VAVIDRAVGGLVHLDHALGLQRRGLPGPKDLRSDRSGRGLCVPAVLRPVTTLVRAAKRLRSGRLDAYLAYLAYMLVALVARWPWSPYWPDRTTAAETVYRSEIRRGV